jgi:transcriptional regulator with PAS, ATPase and Fis domain
LESELFGHEKGAFTGAMYRRKGKLEIANGGTLFLDEVGTIDMKTQVDLLRAIESKEFTRLGGNEIIKSDFRIICATNTDLEKSVKEGIFREDLYYRLQVYTITLEPLRDRPEDIPDLVEHFIQMYRTKMSKPVQGVESDALNKLLKCPWYGNVRELENAIERAMVVAKGKLLHSKDFLLNSDEQKEEISGGKFSLEQVEKKHLLNVLETHNWNVSASAKILGIDRVTIYKKLKKYGIARPDHGPS